MKVAARFTVTRVDGKVRVVLHHGGRALVRLELNPGLAADLGADITAAAKGVDG